MKFLASLIGAFLISTFSAHAQVIESGPQMNFESTIHDYGQIEQNSDGTYVFAFTNTGNEPLIISNAKGSCQCTVPKWPKKPFAPGESGEIVVKYNTAKVGSFQKSVTITSNDADQPTLVLRIKGNVNATPTVSAPVKAAPSAAPTAVTGG